MVKIALPLAPPRSVPSRKSACCCCDPAPSQQALLQSELYASENVHTTKNMMVELHFVVVVVLVSLMMA
jgi:hypothetical protein